MVFHHVGAFLLDARLCDAAKELCGQVRPPVGMTGGVVGVCIAVGDGCEGASGSIDPGGERVVVIGCLVRALGF